MKEIKVGDRFGRLVVIKKITKGRSLLRCDCGNTLELGECKIVCVNRYCMNLLYAPYWGKRR